MITKRESNAIKVKMDLLNAVGLALKKYGFAKLSINTIATEANIDKTAIYRYYEGFEDLLKAYIEKQDYWIKPIRDLGNRQINDMKEVVKTFFKDQFNTLMTSDEFQQLILWELADKDNIAAPITVKREVYSEGVLKQSRISIEKTGINFNFILSVLLGGIYYLVIHKNQYQFCEVDLNQKKHKDELLRTLDWLVDLIYKENEQVSEIEQIAINAHKEGLDIETINRITGIKIEYLNKLIKQDKTNK